MVSLNKTWTTTLEEDGRTGDLLLPFPPELLNQMGWAENDVLEWFDNHDGTFTIKKKEDQE